MHFEKAGLEFRATKDFDIVLVTKVDDSDFSKQIAQFLVEGGYENKYRNEKKTAYRFENPKSPDYPKVIEFFVEEGKFPQSLDKRLAKLNIEVNEEKISAIVLDSEIFEFAQRHIMYDYDLPIVDIKGLIVLKAFAFFKNRDLYKQGLVTGDDYLKHRRDVFRLLTILDNDDAIDDLPELLVKALSDFLPLLKETKDLAKDYHASVDSVVNRFIKIAKL